MKLAWAIVYLLFIGTVSKAQIFIVDSPLEWNNTDNLTYSIQIDEQQADSTYFGNYFANNPTTFDTTITLFPYKKGYIYVNPKDIFKISATINRNEKKDLYIANKYRNGNYSLIKSLFYDPVLTCNTRLMHLVFNMHECILVTPFFFDGYQFTQSVSAVDSLNVVGSNYFIPLTKMNVLSEDTILHFNGNFYYNMQGFHFRPNKEETDVWYKYQFNLQYSKYNKSIITAEIKMIINSIGSINIRKNVRILITKK